MMKRRDFLKSVALAGPSIAWTYAAGADEQAQPIPSTRDWLARWEKNILGDARSRYCDKEMGEELGWLVSPFLNGFYYGYLATRDTKWVEMLIDGTDSCIRRAVKEPDGYLGWPKSGMDAAESFHTDSLLGEAMLLRPVVLMAGEILKTPAIQEEFALKARTYLDLAERVFEKWNSRGCWREVPEGGLWVVPHFGIDPNTGQWTEGYARRATEGFSNPANKENHIAQWLVALHDMTGKPLYRERAEKWFRLMRSRMKTRQDGKYSVWNYWDPAGPWDYKTDGSLKHWVGVHPNGGYYGIDVEAVVTAFEHGMVFTKEDIDRLIATNRDFMWNQQVAEARFRRIDGGEPDPRWKNSPGVLWTALVPHDDTLRKIFIANHDPSDWGGLPTTPWFFAREASIRSQPQTEHTS
jgi:hypothetical protein